jgi:TolB protein
MIVITLLVGCGPAEPTVTPVAPVATVTPAPPAATLLPPVTTAVPPTAAEVQPQTPGSSQGVIAFYSDRDGNAEIYMMAVPDGTDADGSDLRRLTDHPAGDMAPAISPDGTQIAFTSSRDGNNEIYVMSLPDGTDLRRLTDSPAYESHPAWSPDGTRIAFTSERDGNREIYVMDADGSNVQRLTDDPADDLRPDWSPDGTRIAFSRKHGESWDIYVMDLDGSDLERLTETEETEVFPAWSPDGSRLAYMYSVRRGSMAIRVMDADGSNDHPLPGVGQINEDPAWSPDGTRIVFQSNRDGNWEIYVMDADGSNQQRLTNNPAGDYWPSWGPSPPQTMAQDHTDTGEKGDSELAVTHTHVCGFLIMFGGKRILIDSLFQVGSPPTPDERIRAMRQGLPPFDRPDLILVTHDHEDHFDADIVGHNLLNNPEAVLVSTDVVVSQLESRFPQFEQIQDRVIGVHLERGEQERLNVAGIELEIFFLSHGVPAVPNFGYYFSIDGIRFFHTGDMNPEDITLAELQAYGLAEKEIDIAFVSGFRLVNERFSGHILEGIQPKVMVPMHFNFTKAYDRSVLDEVEARFPNVLLFREEMTRQAVDLGMLE